MLEGFKKFIARGNMIDMAVGVVMGGAVTTVVNSIVNSVINPFIAMIFGKPNMDGLLAITFNGATVSFGAVLGTILNFLIIAVAVYFCILVPINKFRDMTEALLAKTKLAEQKEAEEKAAERMFIPVLTPGPRTMGSLPVMRFAACDIAPVSSGTTELIAHPVNSSKP